MKKVLLIILLGFILTSILTITYTIQISSTFSNFSDDNGGNGDNDHDSFDNQVNLRESLNPSKSTIHGNNLLLLIEILVPFASFIEKKNKINMRK
ncbi:MAG: hypothetical protein EAX89_09640 [Candidatus Lokiarchaeota archaeon]|nr:hypothetical protein [Candidatus Lokiarchaeota archaeon]